jgi:hypothetical protein
VIDLETLENIWLYAGKKGLGDWRPSSPRHPGPWGMFRAEVREVK